MGKVSSFQPPRTGGIALRNGVVLVSDRHWAAAVRNATGDISVASGRKPRVPKSGWGIRRARGGPRARKENRQTDVAAAASEGIPLLRGLGRFGESLLVLAQVKIQLPQAELPLEGGRVMGALAGAAGATSFVKALAPKSPLIQETGIALAAFVPAVLALRNSPISGYHGAEHKVIGGREAALRSVRAEQTSQSLRPGSSSEARSVMSKDIEVEGEGHTQPVPLEGAGKSYSVAAAKEHDRCGSNLVGPYLLATVATNLLARAGSSRKSPAASAVAGAVSLGAALEALRWATRNGDSILARLLLLPGHAIQRFLTTSEPTAEQLEVGERALTELLRLEGVSR